MTMERNVGGVESKEQTALRIFYPVLMGMEMYGIHRGYKLWCSFLMIILMVFRFAFSIGHTIHCYIIYSYYLSNLDKLRNVSLVIGNAVFLVVIYFCMKNYETLKASIKEHTENLPTEIVSILKRRVRISCLMVLMMGVCLTSAIVGMVVQLTPRDCLELAAFARHMQNVSSVWAHIFLAGEWLTRVWLTIVPEAIVWMMFSSFFLITKGLFLTYKKKLEECISSSEEAVISAKVMCDSFVNVSNVLEDFNRRLSRLLFWMYLASVFNILVLAKNTYTSNFPLTVQIYGVTELAFRLMIFLYVSHEASSPYDISKSLVPDLYTTANNLPRGSFEEGYYSAIIERIRDFPPTFTGGSIFNFTMKFAVRTLVVIFLYSLLPFQLGLR